MELQLRNVMNAAVNLVWLVCGRPSDGTSFELNCHIPPEARESKTQDDANMRASRDP